MNLFCRVFSFIFFALCVQASSLALDLDWSGQFRSDLNFLQNYNLANGKNALDVTRLNAGGYYVPGGGENLATFQSLFLRLRPTIVVNDNIYIKSEWWLGDPLFGFFGATAPRTRDQQTFFSTFSRGGTISIQRLWGEILTDIGTFRVGRAPMHWGLGIVWNSGEDMWSRYFSTGDMIQLVSKFGAFSIAPSYIRYGVGNSIGGTCLDVTDTVNGVCRTSPGTGAVSDLSIALQYENIDAQMVLGFNYVRRIAQGGQDNTTGFFNLNGGRGGSAYNIFDLFVSKTIKTVRLGAEVPIVIGQVDGVPISSFAVATDAAWDVTDKLGLHMRAGYVPGQGNIGATENPGRYTTFFLHPGYKLGRIMWNYQLRNFAGPNVPNDPNADLLSVYDQPISNAFYFSFDGGYRIGKWRPYGAVTTGLAPQHAATGQRFFNVWERRYSSGAAIEDQSAFLGFELDAGVDFFWDEAFRAGLDLGFFLPGNFYAFSNDPAGRNPANPAFSVGLNVGVQF